jgi:phosphohistidine phosphatase SixA
MERLILLRHGKAEAGSTSGEDIDRPLTERGRRESALIAAAAVFDLTQRTFRLLTPKALDADA